MGSNSVWNQILRGIRFCMKWEIGKLHKSYTLSLIGIFLIYEKNFQWIYFISLNNDIYLLKQHFLLKFFSFLKYQKNSLINVFIWLSNHMYLKFDDLIKLRLAVYFYVNHDAFYNQLADFFYHHYLPNMILPKID
jgi:hypothetical protein